MSIADVALLPKTYMDDNLFTLIANDYAKSCQFQLYIYKAKRLTQPGRTPTEVVHFPERVQRQQEREYGNGTDINLQPCQ